MILLGDKFDADQAKGWGLLRDVVGDEALLPTAIDLAKRLAALPRERVADVRRILARPDGAGLEATMTQETAATVKGFLDPETRLRVAQFR
jgi:enoyl-CoA hydratase/carnithine racemase